MALCRKLAQQGQADDRNAPPDRDPAEPGMQQESRSHEDRQPGSIAEGNQPRAGEELAQRVDVTQPLHMARAGSPQARAVHCVEGRAGDAGIEQQACAHQHSRTDHLQRRVDQQQGAGQHGDPDERRDAAAGQHAVVDLQHVERADEHQQVDEEAEDDRRHEWRADRPHAGVQRRGGRLLAHAGDPEPARWLHARARPVGDPGQRACGFAVVGIASRVTPEGAWRPS